MIKTLCAFLLVLWCSLSWADPFLRTGPAPLSGAQPQTASFTVDGGVAQACIVTPATATVGTIARCDLKALSVAKIYTLVLTWCTPGGIQNSSGGALNVQAGCASSVPFSYELRTPAVPTPTSSVVPSSAD